MESFYQMGELGFHLQDQEQKIEEEGKGLIQTWDATNVGKEGTFHEIVMKFGDSGREIGTEAATELRCWGVTDQGDQELVPDLAPGIEGGEVRIVEAGVGPVPSKGAGVRGHHLNPPGVAESQKIPASHPAPAGSQNLGRDQGQPGSQSQRERDLR